MKPNLNATKTPWIIGTWCKPDPRAGRPKGIYTDEAFGLEICRICEIGAEGEDWANAHLIAAAPDLLAACVTLERAIETGQCSVFEEESSYPICNALCAAIKKATDG